MDNPSSAMAVMLALREPRFITRARVLIADFRRGDTVTAAECIAVLDEMVRGYDDNRNMALAQADAPDG